MSAETPIIEIDRLTRTFGDKVALGDVSFRVGRGEILGYLGPNGAGKSTTMKILTGQLVPTSGSVRILGLDPQRDQREIRRRTAYVPEVAPLYEVLTALEQLELVGALRGIAPAEARRRSQALLDALDLGAVAERPLWTFSRGMRQRVALASGFLERADLVLLDEPLYGLDVQTVMLVKEVVREAARRGAAVVYCSHLLEVVEQLATRVAILSEGEIVADGSPAMLRQERPGANLEQMFRELTVDREVESRVDRFLEAGGGASPEIP